MSYRIIAADPPWMMRDGGPNKRGAAKYPRLTVVELCFFPLPPIDDDAILFLWRLHTMQEQAIRVGRAWGFEPYGELVWLKETVHGKRHMGMGRIVRAEHETCLIMTKGKLLEPLVRNIRSTFRAPVGVRGVQARIHSRKPDAFYEIVEALYDGPRAELFGRRPRPGWDVFGNQTSVDASGARVRSGRIVGRSGRSERPRSARKRSGRSTP